MLEQEVWMFRRSWLRWLSFWIMSKPVINQHFSHSESEREIVRAHCESHMATGWSEEQYFSFVYLCVCVCVCLCLTNIGAQQRTNDMEEVNNNKCIHNVVPSEESPTMDSASVIVIHLSGSSCIPFRWNLEDFIFQVSIVNERILLWPFHWSCWPVRFHLIAESILFDGNFRYESDCEKVHIQIDVTMQSHCHNVLREERGRVGGELLLLYSEMANLIRRKTEKAREFLNRIRFRWIWGESLTVFYLAISELMANQGRVY